MEQGSRALGSDEHLCSPETASILPQECHTSKHQTNTFGVTHPSPLSVDPFDILVANVIALRAKGNWSIRALAEQAQLSRTFVANLERGSSKLTLSAVDKLAAALGVTTASLFAARPVPRDEEASVIEEVLARNLITARRALKLTQESLGQQSGVSMYVIAHIERQARNPSMQTLARLAVALHLSLEELLSVQGKASGGAPVAPHRAG
jgi:transcriptional regulator with XRE-family HTH domain